MKPDYKKEWYNKGSRIVDAKDNYIRINYGCSGKGLLTSIRLFPGVMLMYQELDTEDIFASNKFEGDILSINYCIRGRQESVFQDDTVAYTTEGHMSVNGTTLLPVSFSFPLRVYDGISIVLEDESIDDDTLSLLGTFGIVPGEIRAKYNVINKWFMTMPEKLTADCFTDIWNLKEECDIYKIRLSVLMILSVLMDGNYIDHIEEYHFPHDVIRTVKAICGEMLSDLECEYPIGYYTKKHSISTVLFHRAFLNIYGTTPHKYIINYKMNLAAEEILRGNKISDVALNMGYSNPSKFSKAFKAVFGYLPKDYRKLKQMGYFPDKRL